MHRRVGVNRRDQVLARRLEPAGQRELGDELGGLVAHDVGAQDLAVRQAADDLREAFLMSRRDGLAVGLEVVLANLIILALLETLGDQRLLGEADAGDLRLAVRAARDHRVIDRVRLVVQLASLPRDALDTDNRLL